MSDWVDDPPISNDGDWVDDDKVPGVSQLESGARGLAQGASLGFADEITGGLESLLTDKTYQQARDESRKNYDAAQKANPGTYATGEVGGAVGTAFIPGMQAASGAKFLGSTIKGALTGLAARGTLAGGAAGLGTSKADLTSGDFGEYGQALEDTGRGALTGLVATGAGTALERGLGKVTQAAPKFFDDLAGSQAARALGLERATMKKLGPDKVKDIGHYALDNDIIPLRANTDKMIELNRAAQDRGGKMMGEVYDAIDGAGASTFNPLDVAGKVDEKIGGFYRSPINRGETNQLENTLESILLRGEGNIPLREAQVLKSELGKVANWKNNLQITDKERMAREAYGIVSGAIDSAAENGAKEIGKEGLEGLLSSGKKLYGNASGADTLLQNKAAREQGNKVFGLTDTIAGAGSLGYGATTGDWSTAAGVMALKKGGEKYGNKLVAKGANYVSNMLKSSPQSLGKFAKVLQQAESRGPQGLAASHFVLQQNNPEYRAVLQRAAGEEDPNE